MDDDDDDIDMASPPPEPHEQIHHPHMQHPGMSHMNSRQETASVSPPIHPRNLGAYPQRNGTPQPGISRPSSRNAPRRISNSNLNPQQAQNGYSFIPGPPVYNHANQHPPIPQGVNQDYHYNPNQLQAPPPPPGQQYDDRRQSIPPVFVQPPRQVQNDNPPQMQSNEIHPPSIIEKKPPFKSRSIFTPIVGPDSELGKFMFPSASDSSRDRSSDDMRMQLPRKVTPPPIKSEDHLRESPKQSPPRSAPLPLVPNQQLPPPPARSNSLPSAPAKRPTLTLTIPSEQGDGNDAATATSSPRESTVGGVSRNQQPPTTRLSDAPTGSVVLPPPSPSVTLLSAGATGPVNPFAPRPTTTSGPPEQTPLSALPSRFLSGEMLPSPSTFFSDWGSFGGRGGAGDVLPSPLNFQTPIAGQPQHNIFKEELDTSSKRKSPTLDSPSDASSSSKKVKV